MTIMIQNPQLNMPTKAFLKQCIEDISLGFHAVICFLGKWVPQRAIYEDDQKCEVKLFKLLGVSSGSDQSVLDTVSLDHLHKCSCDMLQAFIHVHMFVILKKDGYSHPPKCDVAHARMGKIVS